MTSLERGRSRVIEIESRSVLSAEKTPIALKGAEVAPVQMGGGCQTYTSTAPDGKQDINWDPD